MHESIQLVIDSLPYLLKGAVFTLQLSIGGMFFGLVLGFILALMRLSPLLPVRWLARFYISIFRGTPLIAQLFMIYYGLPQFGIELDPIPAAMIGLSLNTAAYAAETLRAAISSIDKGQWEAGASIGMTRWQTMRRAILPQAARVALPPLSNSFISLVKDTSLAATIQVPELFRQAQLITSRTLEVFTMYLAASLIYWVMATVLSALQNYFEEQLNRQERAEMSAIEVRNLVKKFHGQTVLHGIDLDVKPGEVVAIIGPSGSGKTTLLRSINLLEQPEAGTIKVGEITIDTARSLTQQKGLIRQLRQHVGFVFQNFNLFPHRTVLENIIEGPVIVKGEPKAEATARARELLAKVGLAGKETSYPRRLSGGQQQRVAIARALAMRPEVILFDEPTSALDPELVGEVLNTIRQLAQEKRTMVIVTHEMSFARDVADRAIFMDQGRIVEQGPAKSLFTHPQQPRTHQFLEKFLMQ